MTIPVVSQIEKLIESSENLYMEQISSWYQRVSQFLKMALGNEVRNEFDLLRWDDTCEGIGFLEGLSAKIITEQALGFVEASSSTTFQENTSAKHISSDLTQVFIVHGHDSETKEKVARFVDKLGLKAIILHEQASSGQTSMEKLEIYSKVAFAVVLLTGDDVGGVADSTDNMRPRARQNVVFELGYFIGRLGRGLVVALLKDDVEIPSDFAGVVYVAVDNADGWKLKLAQEFVKGGLPINLEGVL